MANARYNAAVTLVEMLVVVGIIAVLAGFVLALVMRVEDQSKERGLMNAFALLKGALQEYYDFKGGFPEQAAEDTSEAVAHIELLYEQLDSIPDSRAILDQLSVALVRDVTGEEDIPEIYDPWGTVLDYQYDTNDTFPVLTSAGPDETFDTEDDMTSRDG
jgi:prepilin-type N-terminal cleavage/methylation domain-containing protein